MDQGIIKVRYELKISIMLTLEYNCMSYQIDYY